MWSMELLGPLHRAIVLAAHIHMFLSKMVDGRFAVGAIFSDFEELKDTTLPIVFPYPRCTRDQAYFRMRTLELLLKTHRFLETFYQALAAVAREGLVLGCCSFFFGAAPKVWEGRVQCLRPRAGLYQVEGWRMLGAEPREISIPRSLLIRWCSISGGAKWPSKILLFRQGPMTDVCEVTKLVRGRLKGSTANKALNKVRPYIAPPEIWHVTVVVGCGVKPFEYW
jgi:hypothetical protein